MANLKKELSLYERDEAGILIPQKAKLELDKRDIETYPELADVTVNVTPMTRGEIKKLFNKDSKSNDIKPETSKDQDGELILKHCFEPLYTEEEIPFIKPVISRSLVATIFRESGIKLNAATGQKMIEDDEFGKN